MALYEYSAFDAQGKKKRGVIEALSQTAASRKLRGQGLFPTRLATARNTGGTHQRTFLRQVSAVQLGVATRQLATMLTAGMPLDEALEMVAGQQTKGTLGSVLTRVRDDILQGSALYAAMQAHPKVFQPLYTNMVQVGEASGTLDKVLLQLAEFTDEQARFNAQFKAALTYPLLMFLVGSGVLLFLMTFVVPKITRMLEDMEQALPLPTLFLMSFSHFLATYWWLILIIVVVVILVARRFSLTDRGRLWFDQQRFRLPLVGPLALNIATARFAKTTATLLHSGVPLLTALEIVQNLLGNNYLMQALEVVREKVTEGAGLSEPLSEAEVFPVMLPQMAAVGERSGELEEMLYKVAEIYEHQVKTRMTGLMALLEPLMILLMGSVVGFIVLAILLPIFQASQGMG
ncbi:general secretion pathway protein F [Desulfuromusa kysingii]|uniref:General secretion pathway protein F n=1 Tax=Desulfuromusa kysingii TaxID=37625 RepID=A0A1H3W2J8_9BACT|nr:type II secretion system inner membrane protein GspF [Desulfuromusa kysingii]SDZ81327.1 general secretion pathway protein F [Desulfuromusa kysingii]